MLSFYNCGQKEITNFELFEKIVNDATLSCNNRPGEGFSLSLISVTNPWTHLISDKSPNWFQTNLAKVLMLLANKNASFEFDEIIDAYTQENEDRELKLLNFLKQQNDDFFKTCGDLLLITALHYCSPSFVKYLLVEKNISPNSSMDRNLLMPLYRALVRLNMDEIFNLMLQKGADPNQMVKSTQQPILTSVVNMYGFGRRMEDKSLYALSMLLKHGANPLLGSALPLTESIRVYQSALTLLCEHGAGLVIKNNRFPSHREDQGLMIHSTSPEQKESKESVEKIKSEKRTQEFKGSEIILAARKQAQPDQITWVFSANKFKELLLGTDPELFLPQAEMICKHVRQASQLKNNKVAPEAKTAIEEAAQALKIAFSNTYLVTNMPSDMAKLCFSYMEPYRILIEDSWEKPKSSSSSMKPSPN